jgi:hypothetical protein
MRSIPDRPGYREVEPLNGEREAHHWSEEELATPRT